MNLQPHPADNEAFVDAFNALAEYAHANARNKGFWHVSDRLQSIADAHGLGDEMKLMRNSQLRDLMTSELGEACEGERKNLPSEKIPGFTNAEEEYADLIIRILDMNAARGMRIGEAVIAKMKHNSTRAPMHGGKAY